MKNLQSISGIFFFALGAVYFCLAFFLQMDWVSPNFYVAFNILDVPFAFVALIYAATTIRQSLIDSEIESFFIHQAVSWLCIGLFFGVLYINYYLHSV